MRYVTHHFAHLESLERARRWLVQLGFDPSHLEVRTEGIPRIALLVDADRQAEAEMIINAAEHADPEGWPSFWEIARQEHVQPRAVESVIYAEPARHHSQPIGWHPPDQGQAVAYAWPQAGEVVERFR
jgi:hypothetical protein